MNSPTNGKDLQLNRQISFCIDAIVNKGTNLGTKLDITKWSV